VKSADEVKTVILDQTIKPELGSGFHPVGTFQFEK
jgi:hypothetical protein